jgi:hypothetical protein
MRTLSETNATRNSQTAILLAVILHIALAIGLYLQTSKRTDPERTTPQVEKSAPAKAKPRAVNLP